ncbi:dihydroxyacetone kinase, L subunit [Mycolicibacterium rhodesiae JS60]|nr:dihydroxyacetone kinase, L subunit [Mycolicibacterium rhodesiae JS60]
MTQTLTVDRFGNWLRRFAAAVHDNAALLTELDAAIGDADHGINMDRGMTAVVALLDETTFSSPDALFKKVGMTLVSTVGGASGPLYGTFFLRLGAALQDVDPVEATAFGAALAACATAAAEGRDRITPLVARKGRASYLGERSAGHQDPGATSATLLLECAAAALS